MVLLSLKHTGSNFLLFLTVRIFIALFLIQTPHKTDETYQGPEVAHHMVYGYGELSWEWTFKDPIRNPVFPTYFAIGYYLINLLGVQTSSHLFSLIPKIMQAFIGAGYDVMLLKLNGKYNGTQSNLTMALVSMTNWVSVTYFSRTYINSLQALLTCIAFYFWLKGREESQGYFMLNKKAKHSSTSDNISRVIVVICFVIRGTSITYWMIVWPYELLRDHFSSLNSAFRFIVKNLLWVLAMVSLSVLLSMWWYGRLVWVEYNFFYYNVILGWSKLCGEQPFLQYLVIYQYKIFSFMGVFLVYGVYTSLEEEQGTLKRGGLTELFLLTALNFLLVSFSAHKQLRFILMLLPAEFILVVKGLQRFPSKKIKKILVCVSVAISLYYFVSRNMVFKRGGTTIINYVRDNHEVHEVLYLTQPYELPMYSHVHRNISLIMPEASFATAIQGTSESQLAKQNPEKYLKNLKQKIGHLPQIVITTTGRKEEELLRQSPTWELVLDEWYPSPMAQDYGRYIRLFRSRG